MDKVTVWPLSPRQIRRSNKVQEVGGLLEAGDRTADRNQQKG